MNSQFIAIVGIAVRVARQRTTTGLWRRLIRGDVLLRRHDRAALIGLLGDKTFGHPNYVPVDGWFENPGLFARDFFGVSPREANLLDPQHRSFIECVWEALELSGHGDVESRPRTGLFAGASINTYLPNILGRSVNPTSVHGTEVMLANDKDYFTSRASFKLGLTGPSIAVQSGCSSSLVAVHQAIESLLSYQCDMALAGGVSVQAGVGPGYIYEPGAMFSPDGTCRPFDADASGTVFGDGIGIVVLKRLDDALGNGDYIHAVIRGSAVNNDGADKIGFTAPSVQGQRAVILEAQSVSDVTADDIGLVETHGTATHLGDPIEFTALREAFQESSSVGSPCVLGAVKANVGHLAASAGIIGLIKAVLCVEHGQIPAHPTFKRPNPLLDIEQTPFAINTQPMDWPRAGHRIAGVSSFGVGGTNAHVIIEQASPRRMRSEESGWRAFPISAQTPELLSIHAADLTDYLVDNPHLPLRDVADTLQVLRAPHAAATVLFARDHHEVVSQLAAVQGASHRRLEPSRLVIAIGDAYILDGSGSDSPEQRVLAASERLRDLLGAMTGVVAFLCSPLANAALICARIAGTPPRPEAMIRSRANSGASVHWWDNAVADDGFDALLDVHAETFKATDLIVTLGEDALPLLLSEQAKSVGASVISLEFSGDRSDSMALRDRVAAIWPSGMQRRDQRIDRLPIPARPLEQTLCWYEEQVATTRLNGDSLGSPPDPADLLYVERWSRTEPTGLDLSVPGGWVLVLHDGTGSAGDILAKKLDAIGVDVIGVQPGAQFDRLDGVYSIDPTAREAGWRLDEMLAQDGLAPDCVVCMWALGPREGSAGEVRALDGLFVVFELLAALRARSGKTGRTIVVGSQAISVTGGESLEAEKAGLAGGVRSMSQEFPGLACQYVDVDLEGVSLVEIADQVCEMLSRGPENHVVAIRKRWRWEQRFEPLRGADAAVPGELVCVVTGGLGGVGYTMGRHLAEVHGAKLILVTRAWCPEQARQALDGHDGSAQDRERLERLASLDKAGIRYQIATADLTNPALFAAAISTAEAALGDTANCFIHAAGTSGPAASHWLGKSGRTEWQQVIQPKLDGARLLHELFSQRQTVFGCFVSSLAAERGGLGFGPYAAANRIVDAFVEQHGTAPYFSIAWDGWTNWQPQVGTLDRALITPGLAAEAFGLALLRRKHRRIFVTMTPMQNQDRDFRRRSAAMTQVAPVSLATTPLTLREQITRIWSDSLGVELDPSTNFFDLGGDSLIGIDLIQKMNSTMGTSLSVADLYEAQTIEKMDRLVSRSRTTISDRAEIGGNDA